MSVHGGPVCAVGKVVTEENPYLIAVDEVA